MSLKPNSTRPTARRRSLFLILAACAAATGLAHAAYSITLDEVASQIKPGTGKPEKIRVRRDIMSLAPDSREIKSLRKAVQVMKSRLKTDPTSWEFQANIHATPDADNPAWNQCQHGNYFFLPWHRMYLYWLERIMREASGDPDFALPYWNYISPTARTLPDVYRKPADANTNPLYVAERNKDAGGINNGASLPASAAATIWLPFRLTNFATHSPTGAAFGGLVEKKPGAHSHLMSTMGAFETYHNCMHVLIGGEDGLMSSPFLSSRDPVFLAHHANVDRLWNRWLDQGGGRANPVDDANWMDTKFKFFDENGKQVERAVRECLDLEALGFRYDDDPPPYAQPLPTPAKVAAKPLKVVASLEKLQEFGEQPTRVDIKLNEKVQAAMAGKDSTLELRVEGIDFKLEPVVYYEVYLNLPAKAPANFQDIHYVGNLAFAGINPVAHPGAPPHGHKMETGDLNRLRAFDITKVAHALQDRKLWSDKELTITFVRSGLVPVNNAPVTDSKRKATFAKVTLAAN